MKGDVRFRERSEADVYNDSIGSFLAHIKTRANDVGFEMRKKKNFNKASG